MSCHTCFSADNLQVCAQCQRAKYCSKKCQQQDWNKHKHECYGKRKQTNDDDNDDDDDDAIDTATIKIVEKILAGKKIGNLLRIKNAETELPRILNNAAHPVYTPLTAAVNNRDFSLLSLLLEKGADPNFRDAEDKTAVRRAIFLKADTDAGILLQQPNIDADSAFISTGDSILHTMARRLIHGRWTQRLVYHGANIDKQNVWGETPLMLAVQPSLSDLFNPVVHARNLLEANANPNLRDEKGETALHKAVIIRSAELIELLLENGADSKAKIGETEKAVFPSLTALELARLLEVGDEIVSLLQESE